MKRYNLATTLILLASCLGLSAQTETIYERGSTYLENTLPPSPEPASQVKYADVPFTHSTGMAEYNVPFYTLQGSELNIPISLSYASGGIKLDEIAGVAGLGWNLNAGGCITRTIMDMPDEYVTSVGPFRHQVPSGQLLSDLEGMVNNNTTLSFLRDVVWNRVDTGLDRYSYNICGLSGSFVIQDSGEVFQLSGDGVLINYTRDDDGSVEKFILTGPDGTVYTLAMREMASRDGRGMESIGPMNGKLDQWTAPTAWHLTAMRSRSGLETAVFTYSESVIWNRSIFSTSETLSVICGNQYNTPDRSVSSRNIESLYETRVLTGITLNATEVSFTYSQGTGRAFRTGNSSVLNNFPFRLTEISVRIGENSELLKRMKVNTESASYDGRIVLKGLKSYTDGVLDNQWNFTYKGVGKTVSAGSQDWYGYYNGENEFSDSGNARICPYEINLSGEGSFSLTNGFPNADYAAYMSLTSIDNDGAVTNFTYEGNNFTTTTRASSMGVRVKNIIISDGSLRQAKIRYFFYENPFSNGPDEPSEDMYCTVNMKHVSPGESPDCNWQFTLCETPVTLGPSIRDSRIFYGKVTEYVTDQFLFLFDENTPIPDAARTVYEYSMSDVYPYGANCSDRFSEFCSDFYNGNYAHPLCSGRLGIQDSYNNSGPSVSPVLTRREDYVFKNGSYELVSSVEYEYNMLERNSVLVDYHAVQAYRHWIEGFMEFNDIFHYPVYAKGNFGRHPVKETRVGYHQSGNDTLIVNTAYVARTSLETPVRVSAVNCTEGKILRLMNYGYADNWSDGGSWAGQLRNQHFLSVPIWKSLTNKDISGKHLTLAGNAYKEEVTGYGWFGINGQQYLLPSSHIEYNLGEESWREDVISRDVKGNVTSLKEKGKPETVILWSYGGTLPVAYIQNASFAQVQTAMGGSAVISSLASAQSPSQTHLTKLAQLRSVLPQAHITTYSHIPGIGVESIIDPAGIETSFEYDGGRLVCIRDDDGNKVEEYEYDLLSDANGRRHMHRRTFRSTDGQTFSEDIHWWDAFGRRTQDIALSAAGNSADLVTAYDSDFMFHDDVKIWLPYPKQNTGGNFQTNAKSAAKLYHSNDLSYTLKNYEHSTRDRVISTALPGYAGNHEMRFETDVVDNLLNYRWEDNCIDDLSLYSSDEVVVSKAVDADGRTVSTYADHSGKTLATSLGSDQPTYYIYDLYGRLRAVKSSGIAVSDTLNMWRYGYDHLGRLASKGIPGSVREYYTYDDEDRLVSVLRDGVLKEMEYDPFGRVTEVYLSKDGGQRVLMEQHTYDTYPAGVTGANPKGLKTSSRFAEISPDGGVSGFIDLRFIYDEKKRPVQTQVLYKDGSILSEQTEYGFAGDVISSLYTYSSGGNILGKILQNYNYDKRGRLRSETATLYKSVGQNISALKQYHYDDLGRVSGTVIEVPDGVRLTTDMTHTLQGWVSSQETSVDGEILFAQNLGYDSGSILSGTEPSYTGLLTGKDDIWFRTSQIVSMLKNGYAYDYAGRLVSEVSEDLSTTEYEYDARGNVKAIRIGQDETTYDHLGDRLISVTGPGNYHKNFTHDALGRMTYDGTTDQSITYNNLDLVGKVSKGGTVLANYSYLSDGTKLSALDGSGKGLVYRGPFVYRRSTGSGTSSLTLESAAFGGGRLTPSGAMLYVTDYLGSVRAVVNGSNGAICKASDYSPYGEQSDAESMQTASTPAWITLRDAYTGKEDQHPDFGTNYTDFGARQYSPALCRWMAPDPLSEKYYGTSPYAFCNNNPVNLVDVDGMDWYSYQITKSGIDNQQTLVTEYAWTDATSQDELDDLEVNGTYLGKVVVVFDGYYDERLGVDGTLTGEGAKPANVTVYGPSGASDIQNYTGFTMSSDFATYGAVDNGSYDVTFVSPKPESKIPKTHIVNGGKAVDCLYGKNNYFPNEDAHSATQKDAIYVHRTNTNGFAGYNRKNLNAVSKGCLLIDADEWERYDSQINNTPYTLIINRK